LKSWPDQEITNKYRPYTCPLIGEYFYGETTMAFNCPGTFNRSYNRVVDRFIMTRIAFFLAAIIAFAPVAWAAQTLDYTPGVIHNALAKGKTVFVDYSAVWCGTCARQERVMSALRSEYPKYDKAMVFVRVDWDTYSSHKVATSRRIPRRSTLLVLRGDKELGRIVAGTSREQIKALMDKGLAGGAGS
jgi:thioredoxin 1